NPLPDGRVELRLHTEPSIVSALLIFNDGTPQRLDMTLAAEDSRFKYWEATFLPKASTILYSFAFGLEDGKGYYYGGRGLTHAIETRFELDLEKKKPFVTPDWAKGAVIYQIFPERFHNSDPALNPGSPYFAAWGTKPKSTMFMGGDLPGITDKIDYLAELGVELIYLTPIFASPSNHKYDSTDYYHVDPAFGGNEALRELVTKAHAQGLRVMLDASFNHAHPTFFAFQDIIKNGADSAYVDWFTIHDFPVRIGYRPHLIPAERKEDPSWQEYYTSYLLNSENLGGIPIEIYEDDGDWFEPSYMAWYNVISMPKINQNNPEVRQYFIDVATYWIKEFDIDGWRMDVAQFVPDQFWREFRAACKAVKPDCYLISEIWGSTAHWLNGDMFDGTMNYLFREIALDFFARDRISAAEVKDALLRLEYHYAPQVTQLQQNLLSSHDVSRFLTMTGERVERFRLATLLQMTLPGAPGLYYGDEVGMLGGHDPDNRRAFPWDDREQWNLDLLGTVKQLTALRKTHTVLRTGAFEWLWASDNGDAFAFLRVAGEAKAEIVINRGAEAVVYQPHLAGGHVAFGIVEVDEDELTIMPESGVILVSPEN
ncbi:MAG: glycoside hydrolase family 13 protein, partial [Chloroflexota bacterium]